MSLEFKTGENLALHVHDKHDALPKGEPLRLIAIGHIEGEGDWLGQGSRADVTRDSVTFHYEDADGAEHEITDTFAIKRYGLDTASPVAFQARRAFDNYKIALDAGMKVLPVCLLDEAQGVILMWDWTDDGKYLVMSPMNSNKDWPNGDYTGVVEVEDIPNLETLLIALRAEADNAALRGIKMHADEILFRILAKDPSAGVDFATVDMDTLTQVESGDPTAYIHNEFHVRWALVGWVEKYVVADKVDSYISRIKDFFSS